MVLQILTYTHHTTTMLFGIFLSAFFLGVKQDKKNILQLLSLAVVSGILYVLCVLLFGTETVDQIYPLIVHAPLLFVLVLHYRNLLGGLYRENPVKSRNYEAVKSSKKWENVGNSYIIPALLLYRYSYI